jgi:hypothetical protein
MKKEIFSFKNIVQDLWTGKSPLINPLVPAVIKAWEQTVPGSLRSKIQLEGFKDGALYLIVSNPVAGQQFQFMKDSVQEKINGILGGPVIKQIRVKAGAFEEKIPHQKENTPRSEIAPQPLSRKEKNHIQKLCNEIKNPQVRQQVQAALEKSRRFQKDSS